MALVCSLRSWITVTWNACWTWRERSYFSVTKCRHRLKMVLSKQVLIGYKIIQVLCNRLLISMFIQPAFSLFSLCTLTVEFCIWYLTKSVTQNDSIFLDKLSALMLNVKWSNGQLWLFFLHLLEQLRVFGLANNCNSLLQNNVLSGIKMRWQMWLETK